MEKKITVLLVDDHSLVRRGFRRMLEDEPDMEVVAEVGNGQAALDAYNQHRPNLVLMDVRLPGMSGAEATAAILRSFPDAHVLMLSTHSGEEEIYRAMQAGARGYILKSVLREDLLRAIRDVHAGKRHLDPIVASHLAERVSHKSLTSRELEVLRMVAKGWGNKEIAGALKIAEITVKLHVSHVLEKLNVKDRTEAATAAMQRGIISLD